MPKMSKIPMDLSLGLLDYFLLLVCLGKGGGGGVFLFLASFPKKKKSFTRLFFPLAAVLFVCLHLDSEDVS